MKKKKNNLIFKRIFFVFGLLVFGSFSFSAQAFSIEKNPDNVEGRFIVSPSKVDFELKAGQALTQNLQVTNRLGRTEDFEVKIEDLLTKINEDGSLPLNSAKNWIKPEVDSFSLAQGERMEMTFQINVPKDIPAGGYYASVVVSSKGPGGEKNNVQIVSQIGLATLISISGATTEGGRISFFNQAGPFSFIWKNKFFLLGPVTFSAGFVNEGNIHSNASGEIAVYNFFGNKIAQIPLAKGVVLPGREKSWETIWRKKWLLGFYRAVLTVNYGQNNTPIVQKNFFWAFPLHILLLIIFLFWLIHKINSKFHWKIEIKRKNKNDKVSKM